MKIKYKKIKDELLADYRNIGKKVEEVRTLANMPPLETEEEAAENIADIYEQRDRKSKDEKARTFAPPDNANMPPLETEKEAEINLNDTEDLINEIIKDKDIIRIIYSGKKENNHFNDILNFIDDIKSRKINNSNKEKAYKNMISKNENNVRKCQTLLA